MNKLASTRLNLFILSKKNDPETITKCLHHISEIYTIEQEIRNLAHDLNQDVFIVGNSFKSLLSDYIVEQNAISKTNFTLELEPNFDWETIKPQIKMHLYRIIQQAIHNIISHAQATVAVVCIVIDHPNLCMTITDDGIGFKPENSKEGIGLKNMQQRITILSGKFKIAINDTSGTALYVTLPLDFNKTEIFI